MIKKSALLFTIIVLFVVSVSASKGAHPSPLLQALWNWGHLLLFALVTCYALFFVSGMQNQSLYKQALIVFIITLVLGVGVELWQYVFQNGEPDVNDVIRDFLGSATVFLFIKSFKKKKRLAMVFRLLILVLLVREMLPVAYAASDEIQAYREFPLLADFESQLELSRWQGDAVRSLSRKHAFHSGNALRVELSTARYSSLSLEHFPGDWSAYEKLVFHIYNPDSLVLKLTCRIHDKQHEKNGYPYADRFHKEITLQPGWNPVQIDLQEVKLAPESREMNMHSIQNFMLFSSSLPKKRILYIDDIYLKKTIY